MAFALLLKNSISNTVVVSIERIFFLSGQNENVLFCRQTGFFKDKNKETTGDMFFKEMVQKNIMAFS
jgi:hypothetical protein